MTMKAVVFEEHGDIDRLQVREWAEPALEADEVRIRVGAAAFNGFDPMILRGIPTLKIPLPMIPGGDIAGTIVELGRDVPVGRVHIGDRALVQPLQPGRGMMGETLRGGFCEFVTVPYRYVIGIPDTVDLIDAAALPIAYGTAHRMLMTRAGIAPGDKILILGATGGVGTCCVQLAKLAGAEVTACTSSSAKAAKLRTIGADHVINTSEEDFVEASYRLFGKPKVFGSGGGGVDIVINYIGGATWAKALRTCRRQGQILTCGATDGFDPPTDLRYLWSLELNVRGSNGWDDDDIRSLIDLVATGRLTPVIDSVRPLSEAKLSMQDLIDRRVFGKAVLIP